MVDTIDDDARPAVRGVYRRRQMTPLAGDGIRLMTCTCGTTLRVAGSWTCWTCGTCHELWERDREPEA